MAKRKRIKHQGGAPKSYLRRLPKAIAALQDLEGLIGHEWISDHLNVSKATAIRILGASQAWLFGNTLVVGTDRLREYFERLIESPHAVPEMRRQTRTAKQLTDMARYMSQRQAVVGKKDGSRLTQTQFEKLSKTPGISLSPSRLVIEFQGSNDFLQKFAMVVYALQNDYDAMQQFFDSK